MLIDIITTSRRIRDVIMGYKINLKIRKYHLKPRITAIQKEPVTILRPRKRTRRSQAQMDIFSLSLIALLINSTIHSQAIRLNYFQIINTKSASFFFMLFLFLLLYYYVKLFPEIDEIFSSLSEHMYSFCNG